MIKVVSASVLVMVVIAAIVQVMSGDGSLTRMTTLGGVYAVCKPGGYDVVCFGDKSGSDGGVSCVALSLAGGVCR